MANSAWSDPGVVWPASPANNGKASMALTPRTQLLALCVWAYLGGRQLLLPLSHPQQLCCVCTDACQLHTWRSRINKPYYSASPLHLNLRPSIKVPSHFYFRLNL